MGSNPRPPSNTTPESGTEASGALNVKEKREMEYLHECKSRIQRTTYHQFAYFYRVVAHAAGCRDSARTARRAAQRVRHNAAGLCSSGRVALSAAHTRCTEERAPLAEQWCSAGRSECNGSARRSLSSGAAYIAEELAYPCYTAASTRIWLYMQTRVTVTRAARGKAWADFTFDPEHPRNGPR